MFVFVFLMGFFFVLKNFVVRQGGKNWREKDNSNVFVCVVSWGNRGPNSRGSLVTRHRLFGSAHSQDKHISLLVSLFSYYTHTHDDDDDVVFILVLRSLPIQQPPTHKASQ